MSKSKYFLIAGVAMLGHFGNKTEANNALKAAVTKATAENLATPFLAEDTLHVYEKMSESEMREFRAGLAVPDTSGDPEAEVQALLASDPRFSVKRKKMEQAAEVLKDLRALYAPDAVKAEKVAKEPKAPKEPVEPAKPGAKKKFREIFASVGVVAKREDFADYTDSSLTTAMSDLRSEKYAGGELLDIRRKVADVPEGSPEGTKGAITFERVS